jgi:arylsulfatase A-like enzyme
MEPQRRTYAAMMSAMDDNIGKVLAALTSEGLDETTLVIFLNDNGGPTMWSTGVNGSSNAPLRGSKRQTWEGGIRVAFMIRWKGHLPEGKVDGRPIVQLDVLPTALAAAGVSVRPEWNLDGVDLLPFLNGQRSDAPHDALYWRLGGMMGIRKGDWKLVRAEADFRENDPSAFDDLSDAGLYDLANDIRETTDLAKAHPDKVRELAEEWKRWNSALARPLWPAGHGGH